MALADIIDTYDNGDINGQGTWSGSTNHDVQTTVKQAGTKAIADATGGAIIDASFTIQADGNQVIYCRSTNISTVNYIFAKIREDGANNVSGFRSNNSTIERWDTDGFTSLGSASADTWIKVEMEWKTATDEIRFNLDDGGFTAFKGTAALITTGIDLIRIDGGALSSATVYYDTFEDATPAVGPANLKTWNTVLAANVKTGNTVAIASIKTIDTVA